MKHRNITYLLRYTAVAILTAVGSLHANALQMEDDIIFHAAQLSTNTVSSGSFENLWDNDVNTSFNLVRVAERGDDFENYIEISNFGILEPSATNNNDRKIELQMRRTMLDYNQFNKVQLRAHYVGDPADQFTLIKELNWSFDNMSQAGETKTESNIAIARHVDKFRLYILEAAYDSGNQKYKHPNNDCNIAELMIRYSTYNFKPLKFVLIPSQISSNCTNPVPGEGSNLQFLIDNNGNTHWHSDYQWSNTDIIHTPVDHAEYYIQFQNFGVMPATDGLKNRLAFEFVRRNSNSYNQFTIFDLRAHKAGDPADLFTHITDMPFPYKNVGETVYFDKFAIPFEYDALRIVLKQVGHKHDDGSYSFEDRSNGPFHIAEVRVKSDVYLERPNATELDMLATQFYDPEYNSEYDAYTFRHTRGIAEPINRSSQYYLMNPYYWDNMQWSDIESGNWPNKDILDANNISTPDVTFMDNNDDSRIYNQRQRTHTTEHIVYAIPGVPVLLAPYSDYHALAGQYCVAMQRWYDYKTDGPSGNLFYPFEPQRRMRTHYGDITGHHIRPESGYYTQVPLFWSAEEITPGNEPILALDTYNNMVKEVQIVDGTFHEPLVTRRHIFTIKNGKDQAIELSASKQANDEYIAKNKKYITARSGVRFKTRLDIPYGIGENSPMNLFYLDNDGNPKNVYRVTLEVTKPDGSKVNDWSVFYFGEKYDGHGGIAIDQNNKYISKVGEYGASYDRFLICNAENALPGTYTVRVFGHDAKYNKIYIKGTSEPLVIAEFDITFLEPEAAVLVVDREINQPQYKHTLNSYISGEDGLGLGAPRSKVDFDEFINLYDDHNYNYAANKNTKVYAYKWQLQWAKSNYAFGYNANLDYGAYRLASHSSRTPYMNKCINAYQSADKTHDENFGLENGMYDRLFYDTKGQLAGMYLYVNASGDPGSMMQLNIDPICSGSTIYVTGWMAECSGGSVQDLVLSFRAIKKGSGESVNLNNYITGAIDDNNLGRWNYFYYSFVPNLESFGLTADDIDHYELYIDNNCTNSGGADYAIDDIRIYVAKPRVHAVQTVPICSGGTSTTVRAATPHDVILATIGEKHNPDTNRTLNLYYTFLNKKIFDANFAKYHAEGRDNAYTDAFNDAVLHFDYTGTNSEAKSFGRVTFNTIYSENLPFDNTDWQKPNSYAGSMTVNGERCLVFNAIPTDKDLVIGAEYYMAIYIDEADNVSPGPLHFDITSECAKVCSFIVHSSGVVKIDGTPVPDMTNIQVCENQYPVVQLDIYGRDNIENKFPDDFLLDHNVYIDWYDGSLEQYSAESFEYQGKTILLAEAVSKFREVTEYLDEEDPSVPAKDQYTELARQCLMHYTSWIDDTDPMQLRPRLQLHKASYVFPRLTVPDGLDQMIVYCTAIPINRYSHLNLEEVLVCTDPSEIRVIVANKSPFLMHGINSTDIVYPSTMTDVPVRISLNMLKNTSGDIEASDASVSNKKLFGVPLRWTEGATPGVTRLLQKTDDDYLYLVETNDPAYQHISVPTDNPTGLMIIGRLRQLTAIVIGEKASNNAMLQFKDSFTFREGYYYRIRFNYQEDRYNTSQTICDGQDVITLKVVPEYQKWTPNVNNSFNNDLNWSRVSPDDLLRNDIAGDEFTYQTGSDPHAFNASRNNNRCSYAPIHVVKTINSINDTPLSMDNYSSTNIGYYDFISNINITKPWIKSDNEIANRISTKEIEYDMVAEDHTSGKHIVCRPWQANTCQQMHFNSGAIVLNQHNLRYQSASVDFETEPDNWYSLSSPLKAVVAGDMYLPSANARQSTQLFMPISFNESFYHRFKPAVYQRSWNKAGCANVYNLPGNDPTVRDVAIVSTWSNVFNDVAESYAQGHGFSVKTDIARCATKPDKVKFRLPKADTEYKYYSYDFDADTNSGTVGTPQTPNRVAAEIGRLADNTVTATLTGATAGKYFMAGNPFMAYLDVAKFLAANPALENKIYIMNGSGTSDIMVNADGSVTETGAIATGGVLPPMQGFFVVAKNAATSVAVNYNIDMTVSYPIWASATPLHDKSRSFDTSDVLTITATDSNNNISTATVMLNGNATANFAPYEDMELLIDGNSNVPRVYSLAGNTAVTINTLDNIDRLEVGLVNTDNNPVTLSLSGVGNIGTGLSLYDALSDTYTPLYDDMDVTVTGAVAKRLFITSAAIDTETVNTISVKVDGMDVNVTATNVADGLDVHVFDTMGRNIANVFDPEGDATITLERGIYIINATAGKQYHKQKIVIR